MSEGVLIECTKCDGEREIVDGDGYISWMRPCDMCDGQGNLLDVGKPEPTSPPPETKGTTTKRE